MNPNGQSEIPTTGTEIAIVMGEYKQSDIECMDIAHSPNFQSFADVVHFQYASLDIWISQQPQAHHPLAGKSLLKSSPASIGKSH
jgi:hypothetical protein